MTRLVFAWLVTALVTGSAGAAPGEPGEVVEPAPLPEPPPEPQREPLPEPPPESQPEPLPEPPAEPLAEPTEPAPEPLEPSVEALGFCSEGPFCDGAAVGIEMYLVSGKAIAGPWLDLSFDRWRVDGSLSFIVAQNSQRSFLGNLLTVHGAWQLLELPWLELNAGTGLDVFMLWAINLDERKYGWPVFVEARGETPGGFGAAVQARFYMLASEGIEPGVRRDGESSGLPVFLVVSLYKAGRQ